MSENKQRALVCALADNLNRNGSWCGETHLQKAVYVAKRWLEVPEFTDYEFILYMYGPFSFDLKEELREMRAEGWMRAHFRGGPAYGPTLLPGEQAGELPKSREREFDFIAQQFGGKDVVDLERLTTALLATERLGRNKSVSERSRQLRAWKLHFTESEALRAVQSADEMLKRIDEFRKEAA